MHDHAAQPPHGHSSPGSRAHSLDLVAGILALNFTNTSSGRGGPEHLEHLRAAGDVLAWVHHAGGLTDDELERAARLAPPGSAAAERLFEAARALREAIYGIGLAFAERRQPPPAALAALAAIHADCLSTARLVPRPNGGFAWGWALEENLTHAVLGPIALSAAGLLLGMDLGRVKQCGGQHCGWLFFDQTKNKRRRWCEMSVCGNRAKQRRLRRRRAARPDPRPA
jgi:predicted RNA-binding Zn ribbon-like protein